MGMNRAGGAQCETRVFCSSGLQKNFNEVKHCTEVAGLQLERAPQVAQAFFVASEQVIKHSALVPGLGEVRQPPEDQREARLSQVIALPGDVPGGKVERACRRIVRMVHPHVPDAFFGGVSLDRRAARQAAEQLVEKRSATHRAPRAIAADQSKNLNQ